MGDVNTRGRGFAFLGGRNGLLLRRGSHLVSKLGGCHHKVTWDDALGATTRPVVRLHPVPVPPGPKPLEAPLLYVDVRVLTLKL